MADGIEESPIIIDEEIIFDEVENSQESLKSTDKPKSKNRIILLLQQYKQQVIFGVALSLLVIFFAILFNLFSQEEIPLKTEQELLQAKKYKMVERLKDKAHLKKILKKSDIEKLLLKANMLYSLGQQSQALDIYHQISLYNESLSFYNLGVAKLKEEDYKNAYDAFKSALKNRENQTASAINAAVCAKELGLEKDFEYYIDLAASSIEDEVNSPLYSYYHTLINYYKGNPIKALASIKAPTANYFTSNQNIIAAQIYLQLGDNIGSLDALSKNKKTKDSFTLGLLHANIQEYELAIEYFNTAIENNISKELATQALLLAYLKNSEFLKAAKTINSMPKNYKWENYPIEVFLKKRLFDIDLTQEHFSKKFFLDKEKMYSMIFYFSPYLVFNAKDTFKQIKKGHSTLSVDEIGLAKEFINSSKILSNTNANIAIAIKLALNSHTSKANKLFLKLNKKYKNHDTLEYNLGLSLAQLGDYATAYEHFRRAQFLNKRNRLAGIFALFCAELSGKDTHHIEKNLSKDMQNDPQSIQKVFHNTLFSIYRDNFNAMIRWLEIEKEPDSLYLVTEVLVADRIDRNFIAVEASKELLAKFPDDVVVNILNLYVSNKKTSVKKYAFHIQQFMSSRALNFDSIFYGANIARDLYILMGQISGNLPKIKMLLEAKLSVEADDTSNIIQALGKTNIYLQNFEQAFVQYNQLIDELKIIDTATLSNAAIAAIGSNHKENAIVLLEISKRIDKSNYEARYGLGLLNQEIGNYKAAAIQYGLIEDKNYNSKYFDFRVAPAKKLY